MTTHFIDWDQPHGRVRLAICGAYARTHVDPPSCAECRAILDARDTDEADTEAALNAAVHRAETATSR